MENWNFHFSSIIFIFPFAFPFFGTLPISTNVRWKYKYDAMSRCTSWWYEEHPMGGAEEWRSVEDPWECSLCRAISDDNTIHSQIMPSKWATQRAAKSHSQTNVVSRRWRVTHIQLSWRWMHKYAFKKISPHFFFFRFSLLHVVVTVAVTAWVLVDVVVAAFIVCSSKTTPTNVIKSASWVPAQRAIGETLVSAFEFISLRLATRSSSSSVSSSQLLFVLCSSLSR